MESLRRQKKMLEKASSERDGVRAKAERIKRRTPEEILIEELQNSYQGKLLMASEQYQKGKVDLKKLCSYFNECDVVSNRKIKSSGGMYSMYDIECNGSGDCGKYK